MVSDQERFTAWISIAQELDAIAKHPATHQMPGLTERLNLGGAGFMIVAPRNNNQTGNFEGFWHSSPQTASVNDLKIYACYPDSDVEITRVVASYFPKGKSQYGVYHTQAHQIAMNMQSGETLRFMACFFIHELGHAWDAKKNGRAMTLATSSLNASILEEIEMRTFDYKLALALGGPLYKLQAERLAHNIMQFHTNQQQKPPITGVGAALDYCYGPAPTPEKQENRDHLFWIHCEFMAADRYLSPQHALQAKYNIAAQNMSRSDQPTSNP